MKTQLPQHMLTPQARRAYEIYIDPFAEEDYAARKSDKLADMVLRKLSAGHNIDRQSVQDAGQQSKSVSGKIFELLMEEMLIMHNLAPYYVQVSLWKVPIPRIDFLLYDENEPVIFTCKKSLAERWRQAALEGMFLKNVYPKGKCYLISGKQGDVDRRNEDIDNGKIAGIDRCYMINSAPMRKLLEKLSSTKKFVVASNINPIEKYGRLEKTSLHVNG